MGRSKKKKVKRKVMIKRKRKVFYREKEGRKKENIKGEEISRLDKD